MEVGALHFPEHSRALPSIKAPGVVMTITLGAVQCAANGQLRHLLVGRGVCCDLESVAHAATKT